MSIYILMGCLIVPLLQKMLGTLPIGAIFWLLLGGVFYIGGTYYYAKDKQLSRWMHSHELWHLIVIGGALSHYIYNYVYILNKHLPCIF
ncbi:hemolysin III [Pedobacter terrae]|uniref:Hemolysin III n=1 Tax=Pedobacter terrae TaxID=405671 RepID=A0A1G8APF9_9SPHI|nr:hemolysin III [Pedobacter terrae]